MSEQTTVLSERQEVRVAALRAARSVLVSQSPFTSGSADPMDLINLARYIETGQDPYAQFDPRSSTDTARAHT